MKKINIAIIGVGNHARRIYVPLMDAYSQKLPVNLSVGIDLKGREQNTQAYLHDKQIVMDMVYIDAFDSQKEMPKHTEKILNNLVTEKELDGVIISTDPLSHKVYAKWALSQGLHILMDKPISTRKGVSNDMKQAIGIEKDYQELRALYDKLQTKKQTIFSVNVQRRYELGYQKVFELIREVSQKFNIPVTSIQAMHSDGVWIFPDEIVDQVVHPFNQGYGKGSHSGYHLYDIIWQFYKAGEVKEKSPDEAELTTSFLMPDGLLTQLNQDDYIKYFGKEYNTSKRRATKELYSLYTNYGEIDAFSIIRLLKDKRNICNISLNLLHNTFSRRSWMTPGKDLYKGNGRVKHQYYYIQQGPFQAIQVHNYQANDKHDISNSDDYELGGKNHFDIYVFRNSDMFGEKEKPLKVIKIKDLDKNHKSHETKLYNELAKGPVILEFINFIRGDIKKENLRSNITTHIVPVKIMSALYQSHIKYSKSQNPYVKFAL